MIAYLPNPILCTSLPFRLQATTPNTDPPVTLPACQDLSFILCTCCSLHSESPLTDSPPRQTKSMLLRGIFTLTPQVGVGAHAKGIKHTSQGVCPGPLLQLSSDACAALPPVPGWLTPSLSCLCSNVTFPQRSTMIAYFVPQPAPTLTTPWYLLPYSICHFLQHFSPPSVPYISYLLSALFVISPPSQT